MQLGTVTAKARGLGTHPNPFSDFVFHILHGLISKWNNFNLLMVSTLLVIVNHRAVSRANTQEASVGTESISTVTPMQAGKLSNSPCLPVEVTLDRQELPQRLEN